MKVVSIYDFIFYGVIIYFELMIFFIYLKNENKFFFIIKK